MRGAGSFPAFTQRFSVGIDIPMRVNKSGAFISPVCFSVAVSVLGMVFLLVAYWAWYAAFNF